MPRQIDPTGRGAYRAFDPKSDPQHESNRAPLVKTEVKAVQKPAKTAEQVDKEGNYTAYEHQGAQVGQQPAPTEQPAAKAPAAQPKAQAPPTPISGQGPHQDKKKAG